MFQRTAFDPHKIAFLHSSHVHQMTTDSYLKAGPVAHEVKHVAKLIYFMHDEWLGSRDAQGAVGGLGEILFFLSSDILSKLLACLDKVLTCWNSKEYNSFFELSNTTPASVEFLFAPAFARRFTPCKTILNDLHNSVLS